MAIRLRSTIPKTSKITFLAKMLDLSKDSLKSKNLLQMHRLNPRATCQRVLSKRKSLLHLRLLLLKNIRYPRWLRHFPASMRIHLSKIPLKSTPNSHLQQITLSSIRIPRTQSHRLIAVNHIVLILGNSPRVFRSLSSRLCRRTMELLRTRLWRLLMLGRSLLM